MFQWNNNSSFVFTYISAERKRINKTFKRIREKYYWSDNFERHLKTDVQNVVNSCSSQLQKLTRIKIRQPMGPNTQVESLIRSPWTYLIPFGLSLIYLTLNNARFSNKIFSSHSYQTTYGPWYCFLIHIYKCFRLQVHCIQSNSSWWNIKLHELIHIGNEKIPLRVTLNNCVPSAK